MTRIVRLEIERLAPTGEAVARLSGKTVFVEGALAGERVEAEIVEEKARFARAKVLDVEVASADRRATDGHSSRCGGTDWAHFSPDAARAAKRDLFLETMSRIGGIPPGVFGELPITESPLGYRLRSQFHVERGRAGFYERHSHRIVPIDGCEILSAPTRERVARLAAESEHRGFPETIESVETVETDSDYAVEFWSRTRGIPAGTAPGVEIRSAATGAFEVSPRSFFQVNRFLFPHLYAEVRGRAAALGTGTALDLFSGVGFFTRALAEAGFRVNAVEGAAESSANAIENRRRFPEPDRIRLVESSVEAFLEQGPDAFDLVLADPPRAGLAGFAAAVAQRARAALFYVSCDPASLARDLRAILPLGFEVESAFLEDFFPLTHRVEAFVSLRRRT